jgi:hypothetical protein
VLTSFTVTILPTKHLTVDESAVALRYTARACSIETSLLIALKPNLLGTWYTRASSKKKKFIAKRLQLAESTKACYKRADRLCSTYVCMLTLIFTRLENDLRTQVASVSDMLHTALLVGTVSIVANCCCCYLAIESMLHCKHSSQSIGCFAFIQFILQRLPAPRSACCACLSASLIVQSNIT